MTKRKAEGKAIMPMMVRGRRLACENSRFKVYFEDIVDPTGYEVADYLVVAPKRHLGNLITGVAVLPVVNENVGLVRIYRPAVRDYCWEIPHGFLEEHESEENSAVRELVEETGLEVKDIRSLGYVTPEAGIVAARVHLYVAQSSGIMLQQQGEMGLAGFHVFSISDFECMILRSEIQDSFTLSAWCRYRLSHRI